MWKRNAARTAQSTSTSQSADCRKLGGMCEERSKTGPHWEWVEGIGVLGLVEWERKRGMVLHSQRRHMQLGRVKGEIFDLSVKRSRSPGMFQFEVLTINIIAEIVYVYGWLYNTGTCTWVSKVTYYTSMILYVIYSRYMLCFIMLSGCIDIQK